MKMHRSQYFGFGIIYAPKSEDYSAGLIINFMFWEFNFRWGFSKLKEENIKEFNKKVKDLYKNGEK